MEIDFECSMPELLMKPRGSMRNCSPVMFPTLLACIFCIGWITQRLLALRMTSKKSCDCLCVQAYPICGRWPITKFWCVATTLFHQRRVLYFLIHRLYEQVSVRPRSPFAIPVLHCIRWESLVKMGSLYKAP